MTVYRELRSALDWFRAEWQASLPEKLHESAVHVADDDHLGGPAMTDRFRDYISSGVMWVDGEPWRLEGARGRIRPVLVDMATSGSALERKAAHYLFVLACMDFDPERAGMRMTPPLLPEYSFYYAEKAIVRIAQRMTQHEARSRMPWQMSGRYRELPPSKGRVEAVA
jgi:hypothetical protein